MRILLLTKPSWNSDSKALAVFWGATFAPSEYLAQLEQLGSLLIHEGIVSPMFHHRQTLSFQGILKGVEITTWGWPQLRDVWSSG